MWKFLRTTFVLGYLVAVFSSCNPDVILTGLSDSGSTTTATEVKRIVTTGPSNTFNLMTGSSVSMATNPVTKLPAVAYLDRSANVSGTATIGALKYAWMNAYGVWTIEVVDSNYGTAACGTAGGNCVGAPNVAPTEYHNVIKLAFKSTGAPAIVYAFGGTTAVTKQVRFAERSDYSETGTWSVGVAFTATALVAIATLHLPMKAFTLNFDSSDRPHVTFHHYGATINTDSKLKYLFRDSTGSWQTAVDIASISTGVAVAAAVGAAQVGAAFCPSNGKLWILAYNMSAAAASDGLLVQSASPGADGALTFPAGSTLTIDNGCTGGTLCVAAGATGLTTGVNLGASSAIIGGKTDLSIDSAGTITTAFYTFANPASKLITATSATACQSMASSFTVAPAAGFLGTGLLVGSAETTPGLYGFSLATTPTERILAYSSSTTDVRVNRLITGAYLATGVTLEGTTAGLVGILGNSVGIAYDSTNDLVYAGYGAIPAGVTYALGSDLKVGYALGADVTAASTFPTFAVDIIDQTTNALPLASAAIPSISAAKATNGTVGFAYLYLDPTAADIKFYYGIRGGPDSAPVFGMNNVVNFLEASAATTHLGSYPSLAYDGANNPVIAYHSSLAAGQHMESLQVARSFNGGASFSLTVVDDGSATATSPGVGRYNSVAVTGTTIGVSYYDAQAANTGLKFARYTPTTGWKKFVVDGMTGASGTGCNTTDDAGKYSKLVFDSSGYPIIAYQGATNLRLAVGTPLTATTYSWRCLSVDASADTRGSGIDMVLGSGDILHLAHLDSTNNAIRYVKSSSAVATAIASGSSAFTGEVVDYVGTVTVDTAKPSIRVTSSGKVYVSFHSALSQGLVIKNKTPSATLWTTETVDADSSSAGFISGAGQYHSLLLNDDERPMVFYRSMENWLRYYSQEVP